MNPQPVAFAPPAPRLASATNVTIKKKIGLQKNLFPYISSWSQYSDGGPAIDKLALTIDLRSIIIDIFFIDKLLF